jgi:hypothetical protein
MTFTRYRADLRGLPLPAGDRTVECPTVQASCSLILLRSSRSEPGVAPLPLVGFVRLPPPRRPARARPLPLPVHDPSRARGRSASAGHRHVRSCSACVVSHHPGGLLQACRAGLLHPAAGGGSSRFSRRDPPVITRRIVLRVPRDAFRTPRRTPLVCSRTVSPRPLPSCLSRQILVIVLESVRSEHRVRRGRGVRLGEPSRIFRSPACAWNLAAPDVAARLATPARPRTEARCGRTPREPRFRDPGCDDTPVLSRQPVARPLGSPLRGHADRANAAHCCAELVWGRKSPLCPSIPCSRTSDSRLSAGR